MTIVGNTGHANLTDTTTALIRHGIRAELTKFSGAGLVGIICLARGADQIFADVVLDLGGAIEVVVPAADYFDRIDDKASRERCDAYLRRLPPSIPWPMRRRMTTHTSPRAERSWTGATSCWRSETVVGAAEPDKRLRTHRAWTKRS
jgi:hypothetical protein